MGSLNPELEKNQAIGAKKDAKRQKELQQIQKDLDESREQDPVKFDNDVKGEVDMALLRMSENRVKAEMRVEELEEELAEKDKTIALVQEDLKRSYEENRQLKERLE